MDPAFTAESELENGRPERALVYALLAVVTRLSTIDDALTKIAGRQ